MNLADALEEARENVGQNFSTEPCVVEALLIGLENSRRDNAELRELHRMQLAAISTASLQNTAFTRGARITSDTLIDNTTLAAELDILSDLIPSNSSILSLAADRVRELDYALHTIATLADLPVDATPDTVVQRVRDLVARDTHTCHDQCTRPLCVVTRERDALRKALVDADEVERYNRTDGRREWGQRIDGWLHRDDVVVVMSATAFDAARKEAKP